MDDLATSKMFALVVGVGDYSRSGLPSIINAVNDAKDFRDLLVNHSYVDLNPANVRLLTDSQATAQGIDDCFNWLTRVVSPGSTVFVFFSGHGLRREGGRSQGSYLCPYDVDPGNLRDRGYSRNDLNDSLESIKAKGVLRLVVFLDCCYAGGMKGGSAIGVSHGLTQTDYEELAKASGSVIIASSLANESSYILSGESNSLFTKCLLEALRGDGLEANKHLIYVSDVIGYLSREVPSRHSAQHPYYVSEGQDFPITINPKYKQANKTITDSVDEEKNLKLEQYYSVAIQSLREDNYSRAVANFTKFIRIEQSFVGAYYYRGLAYYSIGDYDAAIEDFSNAIKLSPTYDAAYYARGLVYTSKREYDLAIEDYSKAISLNPADARSYANRGNLWADRQEYVSAMADFNEAIKNDPSLALAYYDRGCTYAQLGEHRLAICDYDEAARLEPNYAAVYYNRGNSYFALGDNFAALADFGASIKADPQHYKPYGNRGKLYTDLNQYQPALNDLNKAIELNPNYEEAYFNRSRLYVLMGEKEKAISDLQKYLDISRDQSRRGIAKQVLKSLWATI